jgi:hypothetical protein
MTFEEMWEQADEVDAEIGGVDSIPEWEYKDYVESLLNQMAGDEKDYPPILNTKVNSKEW